MGGGRTDRLLLVSAVLLLAAVGTRLAWDASGDDPLPPFDLRLVTSLSISGSEGAVRIERGEAGWVVGGVAADAQRVDALLQAWCPGFELAGGWRPSEAEISELGLNEGAPRLRIDGAAGPFVDLLVGQRLEGGRCVLARPDASRAWRVLAPCHRGLAPESWTAP